MEDGIYARMRAGEEYLADDTLFADYSRALNMCMDFNAERDPGRRMAILSELTGSEIDASVQVLPPVSVDFGRFTEFGKDVFVNAGAVFCDQGGIRIGDRVKLGPKVTIVTTNHLLEPEKRRWMVSRPVTVCDDVWIGACATILPGVTIGEGAVVGAGSVVTKDVPPMTVVVGNPARPVKKI